MCTDGLKYVLNFGICNEKEVQREATRLTQSTPHYSLACIVYCRFIDENLQEILFIQLIHCMRMCWWSPFLQAMNM